MASNYSIGTLLKIPLLENSKFFISDIKSGGMGKIYFLKSANNSFFDVVLKEINSIDKDKLYKEISLIITASLFLNVTKYLGIIELDGNQFLVLQKYEGDLTNLDPDKLSAEEIRVLISDLATTLESLYKKYSILHRDIKPQNIMVKNGQVYLGDFGLSVLYKLSENIPSWMMKLESIAVKDRNSSWSGTPSFMCPSALNNNHHVFTIQDDIFSFGVSIVNWLSKGKLPHIANQSFKEPTRELIIKLCPQIRNDDRLINSIHKTLLFDRNYRSQDYSDFVRPHSSGINKLDHIIQTTSSIQFLSKIVEINELENIIKEAVIYYDSHPYIINQLAVFYFRNNSLKKAIEVLIACIESDTYSDKSFYVDPLANLCTFLINDKKIKNSYAYSHILYRLTENSYEYFYYWERYIWFLEGEKINFVEGVIPIIKKRDVSYELFILYCSTTYDLGIMNKYLKKILPYLSGSYLEYARKLLDDAYDNRRAIKQLKIEMGV